MRAILLVLSIVAVVSVGAFEAAIKSTTRLTISAAGVDPNEIIDPGVLALSNVFAGTFIGEPADAPHPSLPRHTISFDIQTLDGIKTDAYLVHYCVDRATGQAFVYLPGWGEPSYRRNVSTILREGQDGRWHRASAKWSHAIQPYLR